MKYDFKIEPCSNGGVIVNLGKDQSVQILDEQKAKLMAAAPEMLELLQEIANANLNQHIIVMQARAIGKTHYQKLLTRVDHVIKKATE
jgi:hypothetical protein